MSEIFRWSFSQWESYDQCPAKWRYQSVLRLPRKPAGPAAKRGTHLHDRAEAYIKGEIDAGNLLIGDPNFKEEDEGFQQATIHPRYLHILDEFRLHPNGDRHTELKLGFDSDASWFLTLCVPAGRGLGRRKVPIVVWSALVNGNLESLKTHILNNGRCMRWRASRSGWQTSLKSLLSILKIQPRPPSWKSRPLRFPDSSRFGTRGVG